MRERPSTRRLAVLALGAALAGGCHHRSAGAKRPAPVTPPAAHRGGRRRAAPKPTAADPDQSPILMGVDVLLQLTPASVVATAGTRKIRLGAVDRAAAADLGAAEDRFVDQVEAVRGAALHREIDDALLDAEAKRRHLPGRKALVKRLVAAAPAPTRAEIARYHAATEALLEAQGVPKAKRLELIRNSLLVQHRRLAVGRRLVALRKRAKVTAAIPVRRVKVAPVGPAQGQEDAPVTVVVFEDETSPRSRAMVPLLHEIRRVYGDRVRLVYRADPRPGHPGAEKVAEAAACAHAEGHFFAYRAALYAHQPPGGSEAIGPKGLWALAAGIPGLRGLGACLDSGRMRATVAADVAAARSAGVTGLPAVFIDGVPVAGLHPLAVFDAIINWELVRPAAPPKGGPVALRSPVPGVDARLGLAPTSVVATVGGRHTTLAEVDRLAGARLTDIERAFVERVQRIRRDAIARVAGKGVQVKDRLAAP